MSCAVFSHIWGFNRNCAMRSLTEPRTCSNTTWPESYALFRYIWGSKCTMRSLTEPRKHPPTIGPSIFGHVWGSNCTLRSLTESCKRPPKIGRSPLRIFQHIWGSNCTMRSLTEPRTPPKHGECPVLVLGTFWGRIRGTRRDSQGNARNCKVSQAGWSLLRAPVGLPPAKGFTKTEPC